MNDFSDNKAETGGFKLLAIRPLKGCDSKFLKNLTKGQVYKFYQDYTFYNGNTEHDIKGDVTRVEYKRTIPQDLYNVGKVNVNISAIVGPNGSGKSTLIELLYVAVYMLAIEEQVLDWNSVEKIETKIKWNRNYQKRRSERAVLIKRKLTSRVNRNTVNRKFTNQRKSTPYSLEKINTTQKLNSFLKELKLIDKQVKNNNGWTLDLEELGKVLSELYTQIKVEIYYEISGTIFCLRIDESNADKHCQISSVPSNSPVFDDDKLTKKIKIENEEKDRYELSSYFFYSLVLNYSQYALNSREVGVWINQLFHKNDGYQTPIVINPMRSKGNFDINTENELVVQRLLANILVPLKVKTETALKDSLRNLAHGHIAYHYKVEFNKGKVDKRFPFTKKYEHFWESISDKFDIKKTAKIENRGELIEFDDYAKEYIYQKMNNMADKYPPYESFLVNDEISDINGFLDMLASDDSHIANKFHQTINFLKYDYCKDLVVFEKWQEIEELSNKIEASKRNGGATQVNSLIQFIPPPFFTIDICFENELKETGTENDKQTNTLGSLSSGEKQSVYSISSIMYHLRYLDSVDKNLPGIDHKYNSINLVFDEVELYYHPEFQRTFILEMLTAIQKSNLKHINNINCVFLTHSPFILSDIPLNNVLRLKGKGEVLPNDKSEFSETFGANIHDLLAKDFLIGSTLGEFVTEQIKKIISFTGKVRGANADEKKVLRTEYLSNKELFQFLANHVGEDVIRTTLKKHVLFIEKALGFSSFSEQLIEQLEVELNRLKGGQNVEN